jgi:hypothetical protein
MIISNSHKFIFVHVMKTAGTSVSAAIDPYLRWNDVAIGGTRFGEQIQPAFRERFGLHKHSTASEIRAVVGGDVWSSYFTFTVVRHPYDRIVSLYTWLHKTLRNARPDATEWSWPVATAFRESSSFSGFIRHEQFRQSLGGRPQVEWTCDDDGHCIVDFVGRFEDLDAARTTISNRSGVNLEPFARHNASTERTRHAEFLSGEADYEYLHTLHEKDFEMFGYDPSLRF